MITTMNLLLWIVAFAVIIPGCSENNQNIVGSDPPLVGDCVGCHTDQPTLVALAKPDTVTVENPGET